MSPQGLRILLFGATGFAGRGALGVCLEDDRVAKVVAVTRRPLRLTHPKLTVVEHDDFLDYAKIENVFDGIDAVYWLLGVSQSDVKDETEYRRITYEYTLAAARVLARRSPRAVFHFLSGAGTRVDGRWMWARIKGETERDLRSVGLGGVVAYRPALIVGGRGERSRYRTEAVLRPLEFLYRPFWGFSVRTRELGAAMVQATVDGRREGALENRDLRRMAAGTR